jgi:hypothetical protein
MWGGAPPLPLRPHDVALNLLNEYVGPILTYTLHFYHILYLCISYDSHNN